MLIKKKLSLREQNELLHSGPGHKKAMSRRDFMGQLGGAVTASVLAPSLLSLFAKKAYADGLNCPILGTSPSDRIPVIEYHAAGGAAWVEDIFCRDRNGDPLTGGTDPYRNYTRLGTTHPMDTTLGLPFHAGSATLTGILDTLNAVLGTDAPNAIQHIDGYSIAVRSNSDSSANTFSPSQWFGLFGRTGMLVNTIGTNSNNLDGSGGRHELAEGSRHLEYSPVLVTNDTQARGLAGAGALVNALGQARAEKIMLAMSNTSQSKLNEFHNMSLSDQIKTLVSCGYVNAVEIPKIFTPDSVFPAAGSAGRTRITNAFSQVVNNQITYASVAHLVINGYAGVGVIERGGYDNHNGTNSGPFSQRQDGGKIIGSILAYAHMLQKPVMLFCSSDGGMGVNDIVDTTTGRLGHPGDSDVLAAAFVLFYHPTATRGGIIANNSIRQIGEFTTGGVNTNYLITSNSTTNAAKAVVLNWLVAQGLENQMGRTGNGVDPFINDRDKYIMTKKIG